MAKNDNLKKQNDNENIVGYITLALTESGQLLIDHNNVLDVGLRIQMLNTALEVEEQIQDTMIAKTPEGNYYS